MKSVHYLREVLKGCLQLNRFRRNARFVFIFILARQLTNATSTIAPRETIKSMKQTLLTLLLFFTIQTASAQHLFPEQYNNCSIGRFCLDCGDPLAKPPEDAVRVIIDGMNQTHLSKIEGLLKVQILVDTLGKPCLISAENNTNISSRKLGLYSAINSMPYWTPAILDSKPQNTSVSLEFLFKNGKVGAQRIVFDYSKSTNFKAVGTPEAKGSNPKDLSVQWTVFNQANSDIPWDMSRAIVADSMNNIWIATDNGLVKISGDSMTVYTSNNSPIRSDHGKTFTTNLTLDAHNTIWFSDGFNGYRYDHNQWTVFDTLQTPLRWTIGIEPDAKGNVYFRTYEGIRKYDGQNWTIIDKSNTDLPTDKISGVYVDSKNRTWIGTYEGNIRIDGDTTVKFNQPENPLSRASIFNMHEDSKGNFWISLYNDDDKSKGGMWLLKPTGEWTCIKPKHSDLFAKNDINDFLLEEEEGILWIALNAVGLIRYDIVRDKWEIYTPENSAVPSIHVMDLTKDKDGLIWASTFAGIIKMKK